MEVGKFTYGHNNIKIKKITNKYKVIIGSFCSIAVGLTIFLDLNHRTDWITTYPFGHINQKIFNKFNGKGHPVGKGNVIIGNDVWIGTNVTIMGGVEIGDGAVIAANSHVVKNIEPYSIYGGNPAQFIKYRFKKEDIDKLLKIKWWNWSNDKINEESPFLCSDNLDEFFKRNLKD